MTKTHQKKVIAVFQDKEEGMPTIFSLLGWITDKLIQTSFQNYG